MNYFLKPQYFLLHMRVESVVEEAVVRKLVVHFVFVCIYEYNAL